MFHITIIWVQMFGYYINKLRYILYFLKKVIQSVNIFVRLSMMVLLFAVLNGKNDFSLYNSIQSNLSKYRQSISSNDFSFNKGTIHLTLNGRRTNIKTILLIGFYSVGIAINRADIHCREVVIEVSYGTKKGNQVTVRSSAEEVFQLSQGRLRPEQFFILIGY